MDNTREKLIELVHEGAQQCSKVFCKECEHFTELAKCKANMVADHLIANGVTLDNQVSSSKWIPVTERLPDKDGSYLILNKRKYIFDAEYESIYKSFGCWHEFIDGAGNEWIAYKEITHWMPLPEPPKGD